MDKMLKKASHLGFISLCNQAENCLSFLFVWPIVCLFVDNLIHSVDINNYTVSVLELWNALFFHCVYEIPLNTTPIFKHSIIFFC